MNHRFLVRAVLSAWLLLSAGLAAAGDDGYVFKLDWQSGPLAGSSSSGSLSFDDALAIPNAQYLATDLLSDFSLVIDGRSYGLNDVTTGYMFFDADAKLTLLAVGTDCFAGGCGVSWDPSTFYLSYNRDAQLDKFSAVAGPAIEGVQSYATGTFQVAAVPEPESLVLLLAGGALLAWRRRGTLAQARGATRRSKRE